MACRDQRPRSRVHRRTVRSLRSKAFSASSSHAECPGHARVAARARSPKPPEIAPAKSSRDAAGQLERREERHTRRSRARRASSDVSSERSASTLSASRSKGPRIPAGRVDSASESRRVQSRAGSASGEGRSESALWDGRPRRQRDSELHATGCGKIEPVECLRGPSWRCAVQRRL